MPENNALAGGRFVLHEELGRGGMGVVWRATDKVLGREVAIKELMTGTGRAESVAPGAEDRLMREARAAARLNHPGAVTVHDVIRHDRGILIVMELVTAPTLAQVLRAEGPLTSVRAAALGAQLADVLDAAHRTGIIHRDVKPDNIMVLRGDRVKLADFGIARVLDEVTTTSSVFGTPAYMAPEQIRGKPQPATDLWALGVTLFQAVEGTSPFARPTPVESIAAVIGDPVPDAERASHALAGLIAAILAREPGDRPDAAQVRESLTAIASGTPTGTPEVPGTRPLATAAAVVPPVITSETGPRHPTTPVPHRLAHTGTPGTPTTGGPAPRPPRRPVFAGLLGLTAVGLWVLAWFRLPVHWVFAAPESLGLDTRPFETWNIQIFYGPVRVAAGVPFVDGTLTAFIVLIHLPFLGLLVASWEILVSVRHATWGAVLTGSAIVWGSAGLVVADLDSATGIPSGWLDSTPYFLAAGAGLLAVFPVVRPGAIVLPGDPRRRLQAAAVPAVGSLCAGLVVPGTLPKAVAVTGTCVLLLGAELVRSHACAAALCAGWAAGMAAPLALRTAVAAQQPISDGYVTDASPVSAWSLTVLAAAVLITGGRAAFRGMQSARGQLPAA